LIFDIMLVFFMLVIYLAVSIGLIALLFYLFYLLGLKLEWDEETYIWPSFLFLIFLIILLNSINIVNQEKSKTTVATTPVCNCVENSRD
jgi:hypothetical protein